MVIACAEPLWAALAGLQLMQPLDGCRISNKQEASAIVASTTFSGLPLDFEVHPIIAGSCLLN